jgi:very-short-patch-repair endonuclease
VLLPVLPRDVFTVADARRQGVTQRQLEWAVETGRLHRLRRGVLCAGSMWSDADPAQRTVLMARAVAASRPPGGRFAFSHGTAAALLGLPVVDLRGPVWLTVPPGGRTRRDEAVVQQAAPLPAGEVTISRGLPCTTSTRTVTDCLRHLPPEDAVAIADAALRAGLVTREELAAAVEQHRWPRAAAASALLPLLDGRRESALESRSAVVLHRHQVPAPEVQVRVLDDRGRFVARVDTLWEDQGVVGEADGLVKYAGASPVRAVAEEKQREARLQALGLVVVRWTAEQLDGDPPLVVEQLRAVLAAGDGRRFRGRFVL